MWDSLVKQNDTPNAYFPVKLFELYQNITLYITTLRMNTTS